MAGISSGSNRPTSDFWWNAPHPDIMTAHIFSLDRWRPDNAIDVRYVWLPVRFTPDGRPFLEWMDAWDLSFFDQPTPSR